jgi:hypothetical protein
MGVNRAQDVKTFGVGINDVPYSRHTRVYNCWINMLKRCYKSGERHRAYADCSVCDEWLTFSNFKRWYDANYREGYTIDKDILIKGNREYHPEKCCFVPNEINTLFMKNIRARNGCGIGVGYRPNKCKSKPYYVHFSVFRKTMHVGSFATKEEAFEAYKKAKELVIKKTAFKYFSEGKIERKVYEAMLNYKIEESD